MKTERRREGGRENEEGKRGREGARGGMREIRFCKEMKTCKSDSSVVRFVHAIVPGGILSVRPSGADWSLMRRALAGGATDGSAAAVRSA